MKIFTRKKLDRSASLQLSINAIVILVMAMVVLGLGLGFIRGLFGKGTQNLGKAIDNSALKNPATADTPITVDRNVQIKMGRMAKLRVGFYNTENQVLTVTPTSTALICNSPQGVGTFTLSSATSTVEPGQATAFEAILFAPATGSGITPKNTYVCPMQPSLSAAGITPPSTQFYVEVIG